MELTGRCGVICCNLQGMYQLCYQAVGCHSWCLTTNSLQYDNEADTFLAANSLISGVPRNFFRGGGVQQIQLRTEDREDRDLGAVAP